MNYKEILKLCGHARLNACHNCRVYEFDYLSDLAKIKAKDEVIQQEVFVYSKQVEMLKRMIKSNIHFCMNINHIPGLIRKKHYLLRILNDQVYYHQWVKENLFHFLVDGTYVTYMT